MAVFTPATRKQAKARIALAGPSGAGKTLTGLKLLYTLTGARTVADGAQRIAFIDTERDSADKYAVDPGQPGVANMTPEQAGGYGFQKTSPVRYDPRELVTTIEEAARAGFTGLQVDSLSHYWFGAGGVLELVDLFTRSNGGRSMDGWRDVRPIERAYIEALMAFPGHVVVCLRSKQRYEIEDGNDGRKRVAKLGMQPDQREGLEFEFDVFGDLDSEHYLRISKTRCAALDGRVIHKPGQELGEQLLDWLAYGEPPQIIDWDQVLKDCTSREELAVWWQQAQRAGQSFALRDKFAARGQEISAARNGPPTAPAEQTDSPPTLKKASADQPDEPAAGTESQQAAPDTAAGGRRAGGARATARAAEVAR
ncbi:AAA family ATPase [Actinoplanes sp. NPDC049316]|uniref:AAA family ATPase n=1 Tax=Actinoplanes sp. NPDC049316 TaxID=3154727 RepID=UPI00341662CA